MIQPESNISVVENELQDSIAFSLLDDLVRAKKIDNNESIFLKKKFGKLFKSVRDLQTRESSLTKLSRTVTNEILTEKLSLEKIKFEEANQKSRVKKMEEDRDIIQMEVDSVEQRLTMSKFELAELRKIHEELMTAINTTKKENKAIVEPALEKLRQQVTDISDQLANADIAFEKENKEKAELMKRVEDIEELIVNKQQEYNKIVELAEQSAIQPNRLARQADAINRAVNNLDNEHKQVQQNVHKRDVEIEKHKRRKDEVEKLKLHLEQQIDLHRLTLERREQEVSILRRNLESQRTDNHELITRKVELNIKKRESDSNLRHRGDQLSFAQKEYESLKRRYKKKISIVDASKNIIPELEAQLHDQELLLQSQVTDNSKMKKESETLKESIEQNLYNLLQLEDIESSKRLEIEELLTAVDEIEADVLRLSIEEKRLIKLHNLVAMQRSIKAGEVTRLGHKEKDARNHVRMKELVIMDLTKRCNEISNRLKEFSALYEVVKNERNKYLALIQSSTQALAEMREKIRILHNEASILISESAAKDKALLKEKGLHHTAKNQRDSLRQDMNVYLSEYRQKQVVVELQIQEIDKLNIVINSMEHDMISLKESYEKAVHVRNGVGVQLIDHNDELCVLYERFKQQKEALSFAEEEVRRKEEELRMLRLQSEELQRQYRAVSRHLPAVEEYRNRLFELEEEITAERKQSDDISGKLEDPQNLDRWRALDGDDPDLEQLVIKTKILEDRLNEKREFLLEKGQALVEITSLTSRLKKQAMLRRDDAKSMAEHLNGLQSRIRDTTKKMLAAVSELSMYQATALRLQQEKAVREKELTDAKWRVEQGYAPNDEAIEDWNRSERHRLLVAESGMKRQEELSIQQPLGMIKSTAIPRPTAYVPEDMIIPKPYGSSSPFKPTMAGSTMRHTRNPQPKPIEI